MRHTLGTFWHSKVLGHTLDARRVSMPMFDMRARGFLVDCDCGKRWAL